jgi:signal transduction histidine kinase
MVATERAVEHTVQFYEQDSFLLDDLTDFIGAALRDDAAAAVIATPTHRALLADRLKQTGLDVGAAEASGQYRALDAADTLRAISLDGVPDPAGIAAVVGVLLDDLAARWGRVRIFGEMVGLLVEEGRHDDAIRLEQLWNELLEMRPCALLCGYRTSTLAAGGPETLADDLALTHTRSLPDESFSLQAAPSDQLCEIAILQQKARRLEAEIAHRQRAEEELREQARTIETINRVGLALVSELDQDQLVQAITDAATELTGAQFGAFFYNVQNEHGEAYTLYTLSGAPREAFERFPMPRNTRVFEPTFRGAGVVRIDDVTRDERYGKNPPYNGMPKGHLPVRSYLAVPVISRTGEVLGGLFFGHAKPGVFTERAEHLLVGVAAQAAIALDNARLFRTAQDAVRVRDEFLAAASHDLKTPLGVIRGRAQILQRHAGRLSGPEAKRITDGLSSIDSTVGKMTRLVDSLLDVTRLHMGQPLPLNLEAVDLVALAHRLAAEHQITTDRHRLQVCATANELTGIWDASRLERLLNNLLGNAIKYSPSGGDVTVSIVTETGPEGGADRVVLAVEDHGLGVPSADLPHILDRFRRGGNVVGKIGGTGIGLAVVRQIAEQHGGRVTLTSREGDGTRVTVRLPLAPG